jgi:nucleoid-associated protein YgaU
MRFVWLEPVAWFEYNPGSIQDLGRAATGFGSPSAPRGMNHKEISMGLMSFLKDAGEKLFGQGEAKAAQEAVASAPTAENRQNLDRAAGDAIKHYIETVGLSASGLAVSFDSASSTCTVSGTCEDQATKEKILLAAGNVAGVGKVDDQMSVLNAQPAAQYHEVQKGDTLSKISKQYYGDPNKYNAIFEANKPMLTHPDKIYPGQMLRIPPQA